MDGAVASADGVRIRYHAEGRGEPALVFVHGWSCNRSYWQAQVPHFARGHRVVALDLAGHGDSGRDRKSWTIPAFAEDVRAVVLALELPRVVLVGHSMGGPVIVEAARKMPERVAALVPVDIFNSVGTKASQEGRDRFLATLRADFPAATRDFVLKGLFVPSSDPALVERVASSMSQAPPEVGIAAMEAIWAYDSAEALGEVKAPIRCINSDRRPTDVEAARRYAPQFEAVVMKGVGHFVMMEDPGTFNRLLERAVKDLVAPANAAAPAKPAAASTPAPKPK